jgi:hypothetical protein
MAKVLFRVMATLLGVAVTPAFLFIAVGGMAHVQ